MYSVFTVASAIVKLIIRRLAEESVNWPCRWDKPVGVLYLSGLSKRRCSLCNLTCGRMESERIKHQKTPGRWDIPDLSTRAKVVSPCLRPPLALPPIYAQDPVRGPARWRETLPRPKDLQERPAKLSIVCIEKPASSAPKCYTCKEKLVRGDFALQERGYKHSGLNPKMTHNLIELINQTNSKEWQWHLQSSKMYCMKKGCAGFSPMPVVVVVPSGKEEAARIAIHAVWH